MRAMISKYVRISQVPTLSMKNWVRFSTSEIFKGRIDVFKGIYIDESELYKTQTEKDFISCLLNSIEDYKRRSLTGVWLRIPTDLSALLETSMQLGFSMHHCDKKGIMTYKWLLEDIPDKIPEYATHYAGVGGIIINSKKQLLVIRESNGDRARGWGIPTGQATADQTMVENVLREVKEETNLDCEFIEFLGLRELSPYQFNRSDLYFICLLRLLDESKEIRLQREEVNEYKWIDQSAVEEIIAKSQVGSPGQMIAFMLAREILNRNKNEAILLPPQKVSMIAMQSQYRFSFINNKLKLYKVRNKDSNIKIYFNKGTRIRNTHCIVRKRCQLTFLVPNDFGHFEQPVGRKNKNKREIKFLSLYMEESIRSFLLYLMEVSLF